MNNVVVTTDIPEKFVYIVSFTAKVLTARNYETFATKKTTVFPNDQIVRYGINNLRYIEPGSPVGKISLCFIHGSK